MQKKLCELLYATASRSVVRFDKKTKKCLPPHNSQNSVAFGQKYLGFFCCANIISNNRQIKWLRLVRFCYAFFTDLVQWRQTNVLTGFCVMAVYTRCELWAQISWRWLYGSFWRYYYLYMRKMRRNYVLKKRIARARYIIVLLLLVLPPLPVRRIFRTHPVIPLYRLHDCRTLGVYYYYNVFHGRTQSTAGTLVHVNRYRFSKEWMSCRAFSAPHCIHFHNIHLLASHYCYSVRGIERKTNVHLNNKIA